MKYIRKHRQGDLFEGLNNLVGNATTATNATTKESVLPYSNEALASGTPVFYQQRSLPRHPLAPNLRQVSKEAESEYFKSIDFLKEIYKGKIKPTTDDVDNFAKETYGSTWLEYYNKNRPLQNDLNKGVFDDDYFKRETEFDRQLALRNLTGYYDFNTHTEQLPDSTKFKEWYNKNNALSKLDVFPSKFNYTYNPKPTNIKGFYNPQNDEYSVDVDEDAVKLNKFTVPVHELTHRLDFLMGYKNRQDTPPVNVSLLNKNKSNLSQAGFNYLSDPFEIRARKNSLKYYLKNNNKPYKYIPTERMDSIYRVRETLPFDVNQLLELYNYQREDLIKFLNK